MTGQIAYRVKAAAEVAGVGAVTITQAIRSGRLRAKRTGQDKNGKPTPTGDYLITRKALEDWIEGLADA